MVRRKTHEEFVAEVKALVGGEYEVLGTYVNSRNILKIKHTKCGREYSVSPNSFLQGARCSKCSGNMRKTTLSFSIEVTAKTNGEYVVLGEYLTNKTPIKIKHYTCGTQYDVKPINFVNGNRCPSCFRKPKKTNDLFKQEVENLTKGDYKVIGEYITTHHKIKMRHLVCSHDYDVAPHNFLSGNRCPKCFGDPKKTTDLFKQEVENLTKGDYKVIGEYVNNKQKIKMRHLVCGNEYSVRPDSFLAGIRCAGCNESKGERVISEFLRDNKIENLREYKNASCRYKNPLPFDFGIMQSNEVSILIEYDGEQHYEAIAHFGGETALRETQHRDAIKTQYCADNGIPLIRIPYWDFDNIETILTEKLLPLLKDADKHNAS